MDIILLIRKNIRHKKGSFKSIIMLMLIIALSITTIASIKENVPSSIEKAYDRVYDSNISLNICSKYLTDEMLDEVAAHPLVKKVETRDALAPWKYTYDNGKKGTFDIRITQIDYRIDRMWNAENTDYLAQIPELKAGEIYLPRAMAENEGANVGDAINIIFNEDTYTYKIAGLVEEPACGSSFMGFKAIFLSEQDFKNLYASREKAAATDHEAVDDLFKTVYITQADDSGYTDSKFASILNSEVSLGSYASGIITRTESLHYQGLMPDIISNIFLSFVIILTVIVFIVMSNSISSRTLYTPFTLATTNSSLV